MKQETSERRRWVAKILSCFRNFIKSLIRPILDYCSQVWCTHRKKDLNILEKVQRRASNVPSVGNIGRDMSYEERLKFLKWPTLQQRILFSSLTECYKTITRLSGLIPSKVLRLHMIFYPQKLITVSNLMYQNNHFKFFFRFRNFAYETLPMRNFRP